MEIETNINKNIADIQYDNIEIMTTIEIELSSIASIQPSYYYQENTALLKWTLIKNPKSQHMHQSLPKSW